VYDEKELGLVFFPASTSPQLGVVSGADASTIMAAQQTPIAKELPQNSFLQEQVASSREKEDDEEFEVWNNTDKVLFAVSSLVTGAIFYKFLTMDNIPPVTPILDEKGRQSLLLQMAPEIQTRPTPRPRSKSPPPTQPAEATAGTMATPVAVPPPRETTKAAAPVALPSPGATVAPATPDPAPIPPDPATADPWSREKNAAAFVASTGTTAAATYALLYVVAGNPAS